MVKVKPQSVGGVKTRRCLEWERAGASRGPQSHGEREQRKTHRPSALQLRPEHPSAASELPAPGDHPVPQALMGPTGCWLLQQPRNPAAA